MNFSRNVVKHNTMRPIEELNLIEDFLFTEASIDQFTSPILMRLIIERATGLRVGKILVEPQKTVNGVDTDCHGIRMDVTVREVVSENGETIRLFDVEPNNIRGENLPRRSRYYQALTDVKLLDTGVDYDKLPDMITIWILPYDPFGLDHMAYSVKNVVEENPEIEYNDGIRKIFLYTGGSQGGSEALKRLLTYIQDSVAENAADEELQRLHTNVERLKSRKEIGVKYMQMHEVIKYKVKEEVEAILPEIKEVLREELRQEVAEEVRQEVAEEVRQEVAEEIRQEVAAEVRQEVAAEVHEEVTLQVTEQVTKQVAQDTKQCMSDLIKLLLDEGRYDDIRRMTEDKEYLNKLLAEYSAK